MDKDNQKKIIPDINEELMMNLMVDGVKTDGLQLPPKPAEELGKEEGQDEVKQDEVPQSKPVPRERNRTKKSLEGSYGERFLKTHSMSKRGDKSIYIRQEYHERLSRIIQVIGKDAIPVAGLFNLKELTACIAMARAMVSVNTGPMHLAAALGTPVLALYARTNPQHSPWMVPCRVIEFDVPTSLKSSNQVLRFQSEKAYPFPAPFPDAKKILNVFEDLLNETASG